MNKFLAARLQGIHQTLWASYDSGNPLSSSSKGHERETFIGMFLSQLLPPIYRFGTGDITAVALSGEEAKRSGQIDIVIEMPWAPSFCIPGTTVRLYPAEAVGVAIEIKSDIGAQWSEVISTATALSVLRQALNGISVLDNALTIHNESVESVPLYAVGYKGWSTADTVREKVNSAMLDGVLVLEHKIFAWSDRRAYSERLLACQADLALKRKDMTLNLPCATCAHIANLAESKLLSNVIIKSLNSERWAISSSLNFSGKQVSVVPAGSWTEESLKKFFTEFLQETKVLTGDEAILQFVAQIHGEVSKRAAMSFDLSRYAG